MRSLLGHPLLALVCGALLMAFGLSGGVSPDGRGGGDDAFLVSQGFAEPGLAVLGSEPEDLLSELDYYPGAVRPGPVAPGPGEDAGLPDGESLAELPGREVQTEPEPAPEPEPEPPPPLVAQVRTHVVRRGETAWDIARMYGIDVDTIIANNDLPDPGRLGVGQTLTILPVRGALHVVRRGQSLWDIAREYRVGMDEIVEANRLADPSRLSVGQRLLIPGVQAQVAAIRREALLDSRGRLVRNFEWPLRGRLSSLYGPRWGRMHSGIDIAVPTGTPIRAAAAGRVSFSGWGGGYGYLVVVDHGNRVETRYGHASRTAVRAGQRVRRGQVIAYSGNTGNSTGPHLHFEIRYRGRAVNPLSYLR